MTTSALLFSELLPCVYLHRKYGKSMFSFIFCLFTDKTICWMCPCGTWLLFNYALYFLFIAEEEQIRDENRKLHDNRMCVICRSYPFDACLLPCGHMGCYVCLSTLEICHLCRAMKEGVQKCWLYPNVEM